MLKEYTCITCPRGCVIEAQVEHDAIVSIEGAACDKGRKFVEQELVDPKRNIATSVLVLNGACPLASVRLTRPVPRAKISALLEAIKHATLNAPVSIGDIVIGNVLGLGSDVIATRHVRALDKNMEVGTWS